MIPRHLTAQQQARAHEISQNAAVADAVTRTIQRRRWMAALRPAGRVGWWLGLPTLVAGLARMGVDEPTSPVAWIGFTLVYAAIICSFLQTFTVYPAALKLLHDIDALHSPDSAGRLQRDKIAESLSRMADVVASSIPLGR